MKLAFTFLITCTLTASSVFAQPVCDDLVLGKSNNKFAIDVYKALLKKNNPVFFAPYSIYSALSMTMEGAKTTTLLEMQRTLYGTGISACLQKGIKNSQQQFNQLLAKGDSIRTANSLW